MGLRLLAALAHGSSVALERAIHRVFHGVGVAAQGDGAEQVGDHERTLIRPDAVHVDLRDHRRVTGARRAGAHHVRVGRGLELAGSERVRLGADDGQAGLLQLLRVQVAKRLDGGSRLCLRLGLVHVQIVDALEQVDALLQTLGLRVMVLEFVRLIVGEVLHALVVQGLDRLLLGGQLLHVTHG